MASLKISDLRPSDFDLLGYSESFLDDLSDNDLATINGGIRGNPTTVVVSGGTTVVVSGGTTVVVSGDTTVVVAGG